jgi:hypothetical protein
MPPFSDKAVYQALVLPAEAIANGGVEILRAGVIDDELYVTARHAFKHPATWGEVLANITRKLGVLYSAETDLTEAEAIAEIEEAYAAEMGAPVIEEKPPRGARKTAPARKAKATASSPRRKSTRSPKRTKR